jgi:hypothetical protein
VRVSGSGIAAGEGAAPEPELDVPGPVPVPDGGVEGRVEEEGVPAGVDDMGTICCGSMAEVGVEIGATPGGVSIDWSCRPTFG